MRIEERKVAVAFLTAVGDSGVQGKVTFTQDGTSDVEVHVELSGVEAS